VWFVNINNFPENHLFQPTQKAAVRKREAALKSELNSIESAASDQHAILRVSDNIDNFLFQLRKTADTMEVLERQKVLRLVNGVAS
jgi:hypothetical protein